MGCGCGRNKGNRASRVKAQLNSKRLKKLTAQKRKIVAQKKLNKAYQAKKQTPATKNERKALCLSCPLSQQTRNERIRGIMVCHKTNRLIESLIKDIRFKCPIGKFGILKQ